MGVGEGDHRRPSERRTTTGANVDERARSAASANLARAAPTASGADRDEPIRRAAPTASGADRDEPVRRALTVANDAAVTDSGRHSRRLVALAGADNGASCTNPGRHAGRVDNDDAGRHARRADNDDADDQLDATSGWRPQAERILKDTRESGSGSGEPR